MPVNILFCEGQSGSPDVRVLRSILRGVPITIQPQGAKYGLGAYIQAYRAARTGVIVAGIRDSDFDRRHDLPTGQSRAWRVEHNRLWLGWFWERTEIENYLLDPAIASHFLDDSILNNAAYQAAIDTAVNTLMDYTAARAALSQSRGRYQPLRNHWGASAGIRDHLLPSERSEVECRTEITGIVTEYGTRIQVADVLARFERLLPDYRMGGTLRQEPLHSFSGKDIMCAMHSTLAGAGFATPGVFREKAINTLETSAEAVWTWLPEWNALRTSIQSVLSNAGPEAHAP